MIEGDGLTMGIILIVVGLLTMILGVALCKKTVNKFLIMVVGLVLFSGGEAGLIGRIDNELYAGRPATIKNIKLNQVFVLNKVLGDGLVVIRSADNPKETDERIISNFFIGELKVGGSYFVVEIKGERSVMLYTPPQKKTSPE